VIVFVLALLIAPAHAADKWKAPGQFQPVGTAPAMPGSTVSLGYPIGRFTPVPDLTTPDGRPKESK
jgi:hypothetical protein